MKVVNKVLNYIDLKIIQDTKMFNFCLDSILLARFWIPSKKIKNILDFGTNNAIIPLIISRYTSAQITGVEIQKEACDIANKNVDLNKLSERIKIVNDDLKEYVKNKNNEFDLIFCNPPFFKVKEESRINESNENLSIARHELKINFNDIIVAAKIALKNGGKFLLIHLSERFDEIICLLKENNFSIKRVQFIYSKENQDAKKVLIEAENDGRSGMKVLKPLFVHDENGTYKKEIQELFGD